jgi:ABC-type multidrug transport system, ATPase component
VLSVKQVAKTYGDKKALLPTDINFFLGETTVLMGPNGAGKTTLMELLCGLQTPDTGGELKAFDHDLIKNPGAHIERIGVQLQETQLFERATARDYLNFFKSLYKKTLPIDEIVKWLRLGEYLDIQIKSLSGGMAQRVALALAVINDPDIVLLDEPTVGLDPISRRDLWNCLKSLKSRGKTLIFTTHYMDEAVNLGDRIIMLSEGRVVFNGLPEEIREKAASLGGGLDEAFEYYVSKK